MPEHKVMLKVSLTSSIPSETAATSNYVSAQSVAKTVSNTRVQGRDKGQLASYIEPGVSVLSVANGECMSTRSC